MKINYQTFKFVTRVIAVIDYANAYHSLESLQAEFNHQHSKLTEEEKAEVAPLQSLFIVTTHFYPDHDSFCLEGTTNAKKWDQVEEKTEEDKNEDELFESEPYLGEPYCGCCGAEGNFLGYK